MAIPDQELIDRLRQIYDSANRGDFGAAIEMAHPEIVLIRAGGQGQLIGPEEISRWLEPDAFESQKLEPLEFEVSENRVLVRVRGTMRGAGSGIEMEIQAWTVWTFDDDRKVTRAEIFLSHEETDARRTLRGD